MKANGKGYITPNYPTISAKQKQDLQELVNSTLIHGLNEADYHKILSVFAEVVTRLESQDIKQQII